MSSCCITSCKNRHDASRKLKFYRIPCDYRPFQANRRRLWLRAIQQANGSAEPLKENARICGAHFISGEASMDHDSPDFVPSVFTRTPQSPSPKKKGKWFYGRRKRRRRAAHTEAETAPPTVDPPVELRSPALIEETQTLSSPSEQEGKAVKEQRTQEVPTGIPNLDHMMPVVLLKSVFAPGSGYLCELCNQHFPIASQLVKHKQMHEEKEERSFSCTICGKLFRSEADFTEHQSVHEPAFPCNMCDRSFTTSQYLKRHKLLHVKDGRKCKMCGMLFCQRHNHILFQPRPQLTQESSSESEEDSSIAKPQYLGSSLLPENNQLVKPVPNQNADDAQSTITVTPSLETTAQTASCTSPNLKPVPKTPEVKNNQLVKLVLNQTADLCDDVQSTTTVIPLQETTAQHVQECDRSFTTSYGLSRHKPMHFQESRGCNTCGMLFCQCHSHNLFQPQTQNCEESCSASEQVSSITEPQHLGSSLLPVSSLLVNPETNPTADLCDGAQSTITVTPLQETAAPTASCAPPNLKPPPKTSKVKPPASHTEVSSEIPIPVLLQSFTVPRRRRPPRPSTLIRLQHPKLPPSLKLFSPQYLTSTFIEVKRNYDYILSKSRGVKMEEDIVQQQNCVVKEEPCELPLSPPKELNTVNVRQIKKFDVPVQSAKKEKIAYDLEFVL